MDVVVDMICSGLCFSDLALMQNSWGMSQFPLVAGHEGIGKIIEVGASVKQRKVGDMVGIGWMRSTCGSCRACIGSKENTCAAMMGGAVTPMVMQNGCFAKQVVVDSKFATPIPDGMDPASAAPLMCAGITVWNPLITYATPMSKVGINAVGGLGHLAVMFASKMGCEVVAMSRGMKKKDAALGFGATSFLDTKDQAQVDAVKGTFDLILDTAPVTGDMEGFFLPLLGPGGRYTTVGAPEDGKKMEFGNFTILPGSQSVGGTGYGTLSQLSDMFIFAARHKIVADVEQMPMSKLPEALEKLKKGEMPKLRITLMCDHA